MEGQWGMERRTEADTHLPLLGCCLLPGTRERAPPRLFARARAPLPSLLYKTLASTKVVTDGGGGGGRTAGSLPPFSVSLYSSCTPAIPLYLALSSSFSSHLSLSTFHTRAEKGKTPCTQPQGMAGIQAGVTASVSCLLLPPPCLLQPTTRHVHASTCNLINVLICSFLDRTDYSVGWGGTCIFGWNWSRAGQGAELSLPSKGTLGCCCHLPPAHTYPSFPLLPQAYHFAGQQGRHALSETSLYPLQTNDKQKACCEHLCCLLRCIIQIIKSFFPPHIDLFAPPHLPFPPYSSHSLHFPSCEWWWAWLNKYVEEGGGHGWKQGNSTGGSLFAPGGEGS